MLPLPKRGLYGELLAGVGTFQDPWAKAVIGIKPHEMVAAYLEGNWSPKTQFSAGAGVRFVLPW